MDPEQLNQERVGYVEYVPGQVGTQYENILSEEKDSLFAAKPKSDQRVDSLDFVDLTRDMAKVNLTASVQGREQEHANYLEP